MKIIKKISGDPILVVNTPVNAIIVLVNVMNSENLGRIEKRIVLDEATQKAENFSNPLNYRPFLALNRNKKGIKGRSISSYTKSNNHSYGEILLPGSVIELEDDNNT